jgi:hypothetical protein
MEEEADPEMTRSVICSGVSVLILAAFHLGGTTAATAAVSPANGTIDGTWIGDVNSVKFEGKPDEYLLQDGTFACKSCTPPRSIAADGTYHPVATYAYYDEESVTVVDDRTVRLSRKLKGREMGHSTMSVTPDGNTLTTNWTDTSDTNAKPSTGSFEENRVARGPAGSHALSGSWTPAKIADVNPDEITLTLKADAAMLHMSAPTGVSYDARLDGTPTPIKGDLAGATVSVKRLSDNAYQEIDTAGGKVIKVNTFTLGPDGKLTIVSESPRDGSKTTWTSNRL